MNRQAAPNAGPNPSAPAHETLIRVTYRMTDQMGVVYYANYLELFEIGRTELLRTTGLTYRQMEQDGFFLPVIHARCDYHSPARYDDELLIRTRLSRLSRVRIDFEYQVLRREGEMLLCHGATHHAIIGANGRPRRLDQVWLERLEPCMPGR
jgi:acyl-CoA thioester hydrolase